MLSSRLAGQSRAGEAGHARFWGAQIETDFLMGMVRHHRSALVMAQMVAEKATHQALKDMAQPIIVNENREIDQMSQWLHGWYGLEPPTGTSMPDAGMMPLQWF
jgi:uncharacterized protein (DUF305 family)